MQKDVITQTATFASENCPSLNAQHHAYLLGYLSWINFGYLTADDIDMARKDILPILREYGDFDTYEVYNFLQLHPLVVAKFAE
jgi:hypothetical protein